MPLPLLPDTIALLREALLAQASVTALVSTRIYDRIPGSPVWPLLVITSVDDDEHPGEPYLGESRMQVDCWGESGSPTHTANARTIARTIRAVARDLDGTYAAGTIINVMPSLLVPQPDPTTGRARFIIDLIITVK